MVSDPFETRNGGIDTAPEQATLKDRVRGLRLGDRLNGAKSRSSSTQWLPWLLCILLAISWAGVGFRWYRIGDGNRSAPVASATSAPTNSVKEDKPAAGKLILERKGYIIAAHQLAVSPIGVEGRIEELNFVEGMMCEKGKVLAKLDSTIYKAQVAEAEAQEAASKARLMESETNREFEILQARSEESQSQAQLEEAKLLLNNARRSLGATSKEDFEQKEKKYLAAEANLQVQRAKLSQVTGKSRDQRIEALRRDWEAAVTRVTTARWRLANCEIKAPVSGIILTKKAEIGNLINPVVGGVSTSLCEMADLSDLEIELEVEERDVSKVERGQECIIKTDAYPERTYLGYVREIMPIANRGKGILPVRIKIEVPKDEAQGRYLKPDMNSLVSIMNAPSKYDKRPTTAKPPPKIDPAPSQPEKKVE